jgi:hypothetical protein
MQCLRSCFAALALVCVSGVARAQDAPPPGPPPGGPPPPPPADYYRSEPEERSANNSIYFELFGPAILYSINYDRVIGDLALRVGFEYLSVSSGLTDNNGVVVNNKASIIGVPITASYIGIGSKKHMLELGGGVTVFSFGAGAGVLGADVNESALFVNPALIMGYRLQPPDGGFLLRAGLAPWYFHVQDATLILPMPYVALGGTF